MVDFDYLDDYISGLWLTFVTASYSAAVAASVLNRPVTVPVDGTVLTAAVAVYVVFTLVALMDVYGKRRVKSAFDLIDNKS